MGFQAFQSNWSHLGAPQVRPRPGLGESLGLRRPGRPAGAPLAGGTTAPTERSPHGEKVFFF